MPPAADPLTNPLYYLDNFHLVLDWVEQRYGDIAGDDERAFIAAFRALPQPSRALLVRLVMRRGELFRATKLAYDEIGPVDDAAAPLLALGWLDAAPPLHLDDLFRLFLKAELEAMFPRLAAVPRKADQHALLREDPGCEDARPLAEWHPLKPASASGASPSARNANGCACCSSAICTRTGPPSSSRTWAS
jgi:hypothetical protein